MNPVPARTEEQFLALLKQSLLLLRKEKLQRIYEGPSALPCQSSTALSDEVLR